MKYYTDEDLSMHDSSDSKFSLRLENEFFDEERDQPQLVISARRVTLPKNGEDWEILVNKKTVLILKGTRFTKKEKKFLYSADGMKFLIASYQAGHHSVAKIKEQMKKVIDRV